MKVDNPSMSFVNRGGKGFLLLGRRRAQECKRIPLRQEIGQGKGALLWHNGTFWHLPSPRPQQGPRKSLRSSTGSVPISRLFPVILDAEGQTPSSLSKLPLTEKQPLTWLILAKTCLIPDELAEPQIKRDWLQLSGVLGKKMFI